MGGSASHLLCGMLAVSVKLWKRLYFQKLSVGWFCVGSGRYGFAWGLGVDFASRVKIAEVRR